MIFNQLAYSLTFSLEFSFSELEEQCISDEYRLYNQAAWILILTFPFTKSVFLRKLLTSPCLGFPICKMGLLIVFTKVEQCLAQSKSLIS